MTIEEGLSKTVKIIICFGLIALISGIIKNQIIINLFEDDFMKIIAVSSYTSLFVSIIISCISLIIIGYICFMIFDLSIVTLSLEEFTDAYSNMIIVFIISELVKVILVVFFLEHELENLSLNQTFEDQIKNTTWVVANRVVDYLGISLGLVTFILSFDYLTDTHKLKKVILISIAIGICLLISSIRWL